MKVRKVRQMKDRKFWTILSGLALLSTITFTNLQAQQVPPISNYAVGLYNEFSAAASGTISFQVQTVQTGSMTALAGKTLGSLVTVPPYRVEADQAGTTITRPRFVVPTDPNFGETDLSHSVDEFASHGFPLQDGAYSKLSVTVTISGDTRSHDAVEFCWASLNHCAVLDPVIVFLQSRIDSRLALAAAGLSTRSAGTLSSPADVATTGRCGLASHPTWIGETLTWSRYSVPFKDVFGITLFTLFLAEQVDGITCDSRCLPQPFGTSSASSAGSFPGYSTQCDNQGATGVTSNHARAIAETKCTESFLGSAHAEVSVNGKGASIGLSWSLGGSVFSNGGVLNDSCSRF
jgi:hypothetical protein